MVTVTSAEFQRDFGRYRDAALREPVSVTSHGREKGLGLRDRGGGERRWIVQTKAGGVKLKRTLGPEKALSR